MTESVKGSRIFSVVLILSLLICQLDFHSFSRRGNMKIWNNQEAPKFFTSGYSVLAWGIIQFITGIIVLAWAGSEKANWILVGCLWFGSGASLTTIWARRLISANSEDWTNHQIFLGTIVALLLLGVSFMAPIIIDLQISAWLVRIASFIMFAFALYITVQRCKSQPVEDCWQ